MTPPRSDIELLKECRRIIESGWAQKHYALDKDVPEGDPRATCWCLSGALFLAKERLGVSKVVYDGVYSLLSKRSGCGVIRFNDAPERTKGEVLGLLDQVIGSLGE